MTRHGDLIPYDGSHQESDHSSRDANGDSDINAEQFRDEAVTLNGLEKATTHHTQENRHEPATKVTTAQDWTGPDDPGNPYNWSLGKRICHTFMGGGLLFSA